MQIPEGTIVDKRFRIGAPLGVGSMGAVYEAKQLDLDRDVAIKFLNESAMDDSEDVARFQREAQVLSTLNHRNIVRVYAFSQWNGSYYMVMERVDGTGLDKHLKAGQSLDRNFVFDIILQVCDGLAAAHAADVVHRDIKPSNIVIAKNGDVKIIDFGFAKVLGPASHQFQQLTEAGTAIGTVLYMSPEQCSGEKVDHRADIYSTGAVMHHCLKGEAPFMGGDYLIVMRKQIHEPVPRLGTQFPEGLQNVLENAMTKKRDERYQSICEMRDDIDRVRLDQTVALRTFTDPIPALENKPKDRKKAVAIGIVASFLLSISLLFYFARHPGQMHSVAEERSDMLSLLETQKTQLRNQVIAEPDRIKKSELFAQLSETLVRIAETSDTGRDKYLDEAVEAAHDAFSRAHFVDKPAMIERLSASFKTQKGRDRRKTLLVALTDDAHSHQKKDTRTAREVYSRVLDLEQNDPDPDAAQYLQITSMNGLLSCDRKLENRNQWQADIERCAGIVLKNSPKTAIAVLQLDGVADSIYKLAPGNSSPELSIAKKLDHALRAGGDMEKDYHELTRAYIFTATIYVRNKDYKPAFELLQSGRQYVAKSSDKSDAELFNRVVKEWLFEIEPIET